MLTCLIRTSSHEVMVISYSNMKIGFGWSVWELCRGYRQFGNGAGVTGRLPVLLIIPNLRTGSWSDHPWKQCNHEPSYGRGLAYYTVGAILCVPNGGARKAGYAWIVGSVMCGDRRGTPRNHLAQEGASRVTVLPYRWNLSGHVQFGWSCGKAL